MFAKSKFSIPIIAVTLLFFSMPAGAQSNDGSQRRMRYISGSETSSNQPVEITTNDGFSSRKQKTVELDKSELSDFDEARMLEREAFELINLRRLERGLTELSWNQKISDIARRHSQNMAVQGFFSHSGQNGKMVDGRAFEFGINDWRAIGENIAFSKGISNPSSFAVERWMLSPGHRNNMLDARWTESAIGVAITTDGKYFFTQVFMVRE